MDTANVSQLPANVTWDLHLTNNPGLSNQATQPHKLDLSLMPPSPMLLATISDPKVHFCSR